MQPEAATDSVKNGTDLAFRYKCPDLECGTYSSFVVRAIVCHPEMCDRAAARVPMASPGARCTGEEPALDSLLQSRWEHLPLAAGSADSELILPGA